MRLRRQTIAIVIIVALIGAFALYRQYQLKRDFAETIKWLDLTYNPHDGGEHFGQGHGYQIHYMLRNGIEEVAEKFQSTFKQLDGCNIRIDSETYAVGVFVKVPSVTHSRINLCDIDPHSIRIKTYDFHKDIGDCSDPDEVTAMKLDCHEAEVEFATRDGRPAIDEERTDTFTDLSGPEHELKSHSKTTKLSFNVDDAEYAKRFANAFRHAVELCGGKPSKF